MYENIGAKIKFVAKAVFALGSSLTVGIGIVLLSLDRTYTKITNMDSITILAGTLLLILGPVFSWLASVPIYGFGELIDKATAIEHNTRGGVSINTASKTESDTPRSETVSTTQRSIDYERISRIEKLRSQGLITEEEYQQAMSKIQ